jgi:acyl-coenzyme A thioesterase PaaI-like protein
MTVTEVKRASASEPFTTIEPKINFFRQVWAAQLRAEGKVVRRDSAIGYV